MVLWHRIVVSMEPRRRAYMAAETGDRTQIMRLVRRANVGASDAAQLRIASRHELASILGRPSSQKGDGDSR